MGNKDCILVGNSEGKNQLGRPKRRWDENINTKTELQRNKV
jgi:hypothetical protein